MNERQPPAKSRTPAGATTPSAVPSPEGATPVMAQYLEVKAAHPDALLFYRMGDFYELFFDDAVEAAAALDIALTKRGQHRGADIPMCGVPVHAAEGYLARLIRKGYRVAVCEQLEDPAEARRSRGYKAVVKRDVVRIVTPGTITEDGLLETRRNNFLASLAEAEGRMALAWLDVSTGEFSVTAVSEAGLGAALAGLELGEILLSERLLARPGMAGPLGDRQGALTPLPPARFDSENGRLRLERLYGVGTLEGFGAFGRAELAAAGALVDYVELTQKGRLPRLGNLRLVADGAVMGIDAATRRNLELTRTLAGEREGSLLAVIDRTVTAAGARLLAAHLAAPLTDPARIAERLDMVAFFVERGETRSKMRDTLRRIPDIERALSRLSLGRGGPRDLAALRDGLAQAPSLRQAIDAAAQAGLGPPAGITACVKDLGDHADLVGELTRAVADDLPFVARDGGFVRKGYAAPLDEQRALRDESRRLTLDLEARYRDMARVPTLKIKHNNVLGWFIEATATHADKLMALTGADGPFIHRQTMANAVRFTTVELSELEERIARAGDRALALELEIFEALVASALAKSDGIARTARALASLDVASALGELAVERRYARPRIDASLAFEIRAGRHPVVEAALAAAHASGFVPNDCVLNASAEKDRASHGVGGAAMTSAEKETSIWLLTGPNMAGKSTFLRQNALIAVLAQMGSFVPTDTAHIGVVDRLFSRVGAADDLARGRSTFMVEMVETATILNQATARSLVILDEIGRGTATFDGLSIAWAAIEHLHEVNHSRALFATHYHELTALAARLARLSCHSMRVKEWEGEVIFLHEVAPGAADRSYGIHVARLAGLPASVIARAEEVLGALEAGEQTGNLAKLADDLPLFSAAATKAKDEPQGPSPLEAELAAINPDELTPKEALELIYRLRGLLSG
jgi:DNA mismatch repair protein MutS